MMKTVWSKYKAMKIQIPFYGLNGLQAHIYKRDKIQTWVRKDGSVWRLFKYIETVNL